MAELRTMARPYARAAFAAAKERDEIALWRGALADLAAVVGRDDLRAALRGPKRLSVRVADEAVKALSERGERVNERINNFMRMLAERRRLPLLGEISRLFETYEADAAGRLRARVTGARAFDADKRAEIEAALKERMGSDVEAIYDEDKTLLAGVLVRVGDRIIDGTLKFRLERLAAELQH